MSRVSVLLLLLLTGFVFGGFAALYWLSPLVYKPAGTPAELDAAPNPDPAADAVAGRREQDPAPGAGDSPPAADPAAGMSHRHSAAAAVDFRADLDPARAEADGLQEGLYFVDGQAATGLRLRHVATRSAQRYMPETMGGGVVIADFNRDAAPDVVLINSGDLQAAARPAGAENRLLLNDGGGRFSDAGAAWKLPSPGYGMGAAAGDYDGDGWTDLLLTAFGAPVVLLRNAAGSGFVDVTAASGIAGGVVHHNEDNSGAVSGASARRVGAPDLAAAAAEGDAPSTSLADAPWTTAAAFFDMENDGDLDLFIAGYVDYRLETALKCYDKGVHVYCTPVMYEAEYDRLLRNNGDGTFTDVSLQAGVRGEPGKSLALAAGDIDSDGDVDLYVANDTSRNVLLVNDGSGGFADLAMAAGVAYDDFGREQAGMGTDLADFDGNSRIDITCTNFQGEASSMYLQLQPLIFVDAADSFGVGAVTRRRLSFGVDLFDADNDGDEDMLIANGHIADNIASYREGAGFAQRNTLYENTAPGMKDVTAQAGPALETVAVSRGLATSDLDSDGDLDFIVINNDDEATIGINVSRRGHFVGLWLEGRPSNRSAVGARVEARIGDRPIVRQVLGSSSYLSVCDQRVHLGLGSADTAHDLKIIWPGGRIQEIAALPAGRYYHVVEGADPVPVIPGAAVIPPAAFQE